MGCFDWDGVILDVGGGVLILVDDLFVCGYYDLIVLDLLVEVLGIVC